MSSSTNDKIKGTAKEAAGKVKEETGKAIGNPDLQGRGTAEKTEGKVERKVGEVKKVFGK
ncbi:MAG: CsbD family protein [Verrucomicrobiota bacterium]|nr:CsbD family protein [Verrucomicrobiota bacterium]